MASLRVDPNEVVVVPAHGRSDKRPIVELARADADGITKHDRDQREIYSRRGFRCFVRSLASRSAKALGSAVIAGVCTEGLRRARNAIAYASRCRSAALFEVSVFALQ